MNKASQPNSELRDK